MFVRPISGESNAERVLRLSSCDDVVRSLAVAAAVLLGPPAPDDEPPAAEPPPAAEAPPTFRTKGPPAAAVVATSPEPPMTWQLAAAVVAEDGGRPWGAELALGGAIAAALARPGWSLGLELRAFTPRTATVGRGRLISASAAISLLPCSRLQRLELCAALTGELLSARSRGLDVDGSVWRGSPALGGRVAYRIGSGRWRLRPSLRLELPLTRWAFTLDQTEVVRRGPVTVGAGLDLVGELP
jgi:hypothetical protein